MNQSFQFFAASLFGVSLMTAGASCANTSPDGVSNTKVDPNNSDDTTSAWFSCGDEVRAAFRGDQVLLDFGDEIYGEHTTSFAYAYNVQTTTDPTTASSADTELSQITHIQYLYPAYPESNVNPITGNKDIMVESIEFGTLSNQFEPDEYTTITIHYQNFGEAPNSPYGIGTSFVSADCNGTEVADALHILNSQLTPIAECLKPSSTGFYTKSDGCRQNPD